MYIYTRYAYISSLPFGGQSENFCPAGCAVFFPDTRENVPAISVAVIISQKKNVTTVRKEQAIIWRLIVIVNEMSNNKINK